MGMTKTWTSSSDMAFYYGDGSVQNATLVGAYGNGSTRYGQVLWFTTDSSGGVGFSFTWKPKSSVGSDLTVYCRITTVRSDGCTNNSGNAILMTSQSGGGLGCSDNSFVFLPNTTYYIYINRSGYDRGYYYYASGSPASYGTASITINGTSVHGLTMTEGTGSDVSVVCTSSPTGKTALNTALSSGATIYHGDVLEVTFTANPGYSIETHTLNGTEFTSGNSHTVAGDVVVIVTAKILGAAYIEIDGVQMMFLVYIDTGSDWVQAVPYVDDGTSWGVCS